MSDSITISGEYLERLRRITDTQGNCPMCALKHPQRMGESLHHTADCPLFIAPPAIDTSNKFMVGMNAQGIHIMKNMALRGMLSIPDALNLAANIVAICDDGTFDKLLEAIRNT